MKKSDKILPILIGVFVCIMSMLIFFGILMYKTGEHNTTGLKYITDTSQNKSIDQTKYEYNNILQLKSQSDNDISYQAGTSDIGEYNYLCGKMEDLFELLSVSNYEDGFKMIDKDFLEFNNINTVEQFRTYIEKKNYNNASPMITKVNMLKRGNTNIYVCNVVIYPRISEDYTYVKDGISNKTLLSGKGIPNVIVISEDDKGLVTFAMDGFIKNTKLSNVSYRNDVFEVVTISRIDFNNNVSVFKMKFKNLTSTMQSLGSSIGKLIFTDSKGHKFYSEDLPQTIEYDLAPGMENVIDIKVKHDQHNISSVKFYIISN